MSAAVAILGVIPRLRFSCSLNGGRGVDICCDKCAQRPSVCSLLSIPSCAGPLGVAVKGPKLGPTFKRGVSIGCEKKGVRGRRVLCYNLECGGAVGSVDQGEACSRGDKMCADQPRGVGNG